MSYGKTMTLRLEPLDRVRTYELVVRQLRQEIFAGRLRPGDRLPGERQLSEQLNVSRPSVREAVRILQAMGVLKSTPGTGANSGLVVSTRPSRALTELLGLHVALSSYSVAEIMDVRLALETRIVRQAAENPGELPEEIDRYLDDMADPGVDRHEFHDLDAELHVAFARASSNRFMADLMAAMREAVRGPMTAAFVDDENWPDRHQTLVREHVEIYEAIKAGDGNLAEHLIRQHIEHVYQTVSSVDPQ